MRVNTIQDKWNGTVRHNNIFIILDNEIIPFSTNYYSYMVQESSSKSLQVDGNDSWADEKYERSEEIAWEETDVEQSFFACGN